jgi:DNA-binding winged helix-turn-helix (wHTH) protein
VSETLHSNCSYRFGLFELDSATGDLRKEGKQRPRVQGQPLEVLLHLLSRPGDVVTREELRLMLWPVDTFVDYDHSLNTAVNKLRDALNDAADNPRFIQTIPRRGYRFIASVEVVAFGKTNGATPAAEQSERSAPQAAVAAKDAAPVTVPIEEQFPEKRNLVFSDPHDLPDAPRGTVQILFSLIQLMYLAFYVISLARIQKVELLLAETVQHPKVAFALLLGTALAGIPVRLYLLSASVFGYRGLSLKFLRLFPFVFPLDELWALAPFLLIDEIGTGLALAITAALLYVPFSQRSLMLMGDRRATRSGRA